MAISYETFGPFELPRDGHKVEKDGLKIFWTQREQDSPGLSQAVGVYIFSIRSERDETSQPWYVGRTDKQGFRKRFTQKELHFRQVLDSEKKGQLEITLLALKAPNKKGFRKLTTTKINSNEWLESTLIGSCFSINRKLLNASKVAYLRSMKVPGFMNDGVGRLSSPADALRGLLRLPKIS